MARKVWVIDENPEEKDSSTTIRKRIIPTAQQKSVYYRNPSIAYSLSIIVWGCGQFYNRQWKLGILFLFYMIYFYLCMSIFIIYWESIKSAFESIYVDCSGALIISGLIYLSGLIVWQLNAWQSYYKSIKINTLSPVGIKMTLLPSFCSLLLPGWGQLLNGQTKKGLFFQFFACAGLATLPFILIIFFVWPTLEESRSRLIIEWIFSISIILSPFILMMWMYSIFDAAKVSRDNTKKEPLARRIKYAKNRFRYHVQIHGWKNALLPLIKRTALAILMLIFCYITYHSVPKNFYMEQLQNLGDRMSENEMTVIPGIIKQLTNSISFGK